MIKSLSLVGAGFALALGFASCTMLGYQQGQRSVLGACYAYSKFHYDGTEFINCFPGREIEIVEGSKKGKKR